MIALQHAGVEDVFHFVEPIKLKLQRVQAHLKVERREAAVHCRQRLGLSHTVSFRDSSYRYASQAIPIHLLVFAVDVDQRDNVSSFDAPDLALSYAGKWVMTE